MSVAEDGGDEPSSPVERFCQAGDAGFSAGFALFVAAVAP